MSSSVPDFSLEARRFLNEASSALQPVEGEGLRPEAVGEAQANATIGLGYAVLAVDQHLSRLEPSPGS